MSFEAKKKKTFLTDSQYINHNNQSVVRPVIAISKMFFKQKNEIKHMHTMDVVVVKVCVYLLHVLCPRQHNKGQIEPVSELFLGRRIRRKIRRKIKLMQRQNRHAVANLDQNLKL